jgi:hypothetical protein
MERHVPGIAGQGRPFLHIPAEADAPRIGQGGAGAVVITGTLAQTVQGAVEADQGKEDDVRRDLLAIRGGLKQPAGSCQERLARAPDEKAQRLRRIDRMGQGDDGARRGGRGEDRRRIAFIADRDIAGEDAAPGDPPQNPVGQGLGDDLALTLAQPGEERRPAGTQEFA